MKEHSEEFKNKIVELGRQIDSKLIYDDRELVEELYSVTPHFKGNMLKSTMKQLDVETTEDIPIGTEVNYQLGLLVDDEYEWLDYGNYIVYSSEKQEDKGTYKLVCYDKLLNSMKEYEGIEGTFPMTLREYLNAICTKIEIEFGSNGDNFANYDRTIPSDRYLGVADYTYRDVLDEIAQATGSMICLDKDDKLIVKYINEGIDNYNTVEGTSFELDDASGGLGSSITELEGNTTQDGTPTPDNPVEIKTVSEDNEVVVGKNRLKINDFTLGSNGLTYTCTNSIIRIQGTAGNAGYSTLELTPYVNMDELNAIPNGTQLTFSVLGITGIGASQIFIGQTGNLYYWQPSASTKMVSKPKSAEITRVVIWFATTQGQTYDIYMNPQFEVGSTATTYESPQGNSYRVDFGGKNKLDIKDNLIGTHGGITTTYNEDNSITISGTPTNTWAWVTNEVTQTLPIGQYTLSITNALTFRIYVQLTFTDNTTQNYIVNNGVKALTFTTAKVAKKYRVILSNLSTGTTYNETTKVMLASGTDTYFSPYVEKPIQLNKIGNYVDKLFKAVTGNPTYDSLDSTTKASLTYGSWYIEKNIGKVVLNGSEDWFYYTATSKPVFYLLCENYGINYKQQSGLICYSNYYLGKGQVNSFDNVYNLGNNVIAFRTSFTRLVIRNDSITSVADLDTWLSTHNTELYYVLATPTYEIIDNENLIQQLDAIQNIELIENLCYVDWVGTEKPKMTLKYYQGRTLEEINEEYLKDVNVDFGEKYGPVNSIVLSRSGESDNVYIQDEDSIEENGLHELKIVDNQLMNFNDRSDYLPSIFEKLDGLEYYINDFTSTGICYLELGDRYYVNIGNERYSCIMFNDEIDVTLGIQELVHTDIPKETKTDYAKADKTDRKINQTYLIVDKQNQQIQTVVNEIGDRSEKQTTITQDIDGINSEVSNLIDITIDGETSDNHLVMDNISLCQPVELKVRPVVNSIEYIYPKSNRYPSGSLYSPTRYVTFRRTYIDSEDGYQEKTEDINYELPCDLLYLDSTHYDELELDYNTKTCKVIKRVEYNSSGNLVAKQVIETLNFEYPYVEIRSGDYEIFIPGYTYAYIYVKLIKKNEYTTQFTTQVEVETQVKQTENEVMISVNQKVDEENFTRAEIVARINNDETSEAAIKADAISLEGYTTINGGFSVDTEGNASIANGSVKINEGGIQLANGRSIIGGNGMLTQFQYNGNGLVGHMQGANTVNQRVALYIPVYIPQNFIITEAKLFLTHTYAYVYEYTQSGYQQYNCYARNVKLYYGNMRGIPQLSGGFVDSIAPTVAGTVVSDFGSSSGKTFPSSSSEDVVVDGISEYLREGMQYLYLADYVNNPSDWVTASRMSGNIDATLYVTGYLQNNIE